MQPAARCISGYATPLGHPIPRSKHTALCALLLASIGPQASLLALLPTMADSAPPEQQVPAEASPDVEQITYKISELLKKPDAE